MLALVHFASSSHLSGAWVHEELGIWILGDGFMENWCIQRSWFDSGCVHASSTELFALFHTFSTSKWTSYPVLLAALRSAGKLVGLGDDVAMLSSAAQCLVCGLLYASVCGVEEFHVFPRGKWTSDPVVVPSPSSRAATSPLSLVFSALHGFFCSPLYLAVTCTVFCVRLWSTGLWTFMEDHFRNGFRNQYSLVRQWIHVRRQSTRLPGRISHVLYVKVASDRIHEKVRMI